MKYAIATAILLSLQAVGRLGAGVPKGATAGGGQTLLTTSDFNMSSICYYDLQVNGNDSPGALGLTYRYVGGDLRLMVMEVSGVPGTVNEISLAGKSCGDTVTATTNSWSNIHAGFLTTGDYTSRMFSIRWDAAQSKLWSMVAEDYITTYQQAKIFTRDLSGGGIANLHGPVGLENVGERLVFGSVVSVPSAYQASCSLPAYATLGGNASSARANHTSLGSVGYAFPDIAGYSNSTEIPAASFKTLMSHEAGVVATDWYGAGTVTTKDRGRRASGIVPDNYYDSAYPGLPAPPLLAASTYGAAWNGAAPDGYARWEDTTRYSATGAWINTTTKKGIAYLLSGCKHGAKCYYASSDLHATGKGFELHVYDPADLCAVAAGSLDPWKVQPSSMLDITASLPGLTSIGQSDGLVSMFGGATYDTTTDTYWASSGFARANYLRIYKIPVAQ